MKMLYSGVAVSASMLVGVSSGFVAMPVKRVSTVLRVERPEHVIAAGCGIPVVPSGGNSLFNPGEQGKLGGTGECEDRLAKGYQFQYLPATQAGASAAPTDVQDAQHWLEDIGLPLNFAKPNAPVTATVLGRTKLISDDAPGDIEHIVLRLPEGMHYVEGQSLSVIPPGVDPKTGKAYKPRLYSIASTRYGDLLDGNTVSLCVRRAEYYDPATGRPDATKQGVCSHFLCNAQPGQQVQVAGPVGKTMLLPEDNNADLIFVATGTGIAPFRAFLHRLFMENTVARHMFTGKVWLILGVPVTGGLLYPQELDAMVENASSLSSSFEVTYAISREMTNQNGGKLYVQHVLAERADELFQRLDQGASIYFCGLKGMMPGILEALDEVATARGVDWNQRLKQLQANHQWHVEVY